MNTHVRVCDTLECLFTNMQSHALPDGSFRVAGNLKYDLASLAAMKQLYVKYWAAAPSAGTVQVPFPNADIAFDTAASAGVVPIQDSKYMFVVNYPNAYYRDIGTEFVPPSVALQVTDEYNRVLTPVYRFNLNHPPIPGVNTETFVPGGSPTRVMSQWELLVSKAGRGSYSA